MKVLAVGNAGLYEARTFSLVADILDGRGLEVVLFRQDLCLQGETLSFHVQRNVSRYQVAIDGVSLDPSDFAAIWYLKPQLPRELLKYEPEKYRNLLAQQFLHLRQGLWSIFRTKRWVNDPWSCYIADNKLYQLHIATQVGLQVPDTVVTSDPILAKEFYDICCGDVVVKLLAPTPLLDEVIYTNRVTPWDMKQIESVRFSPSIFQRNVQKQYELRITVVGERVFPVRINSQADEHLAIDWRRKPKMDDYDVEMSSCDLPDVIRKQIQALMCALGLDFGCIDMIVTPDGEYVFLEINPNGQWYFVQQKAGVRIAEAIADILEKG